MKTNRGDVAGRWARAQQEAGSSVLIVMLLLAIVMMYVGANLKTLGFLKQELNLIEKQQIHRVQKLR